MSRVGPRAKNRRKHAHHRPTDVFLHIPPGGRGDNCLILHKPHCETIDLTLALTRLWAVGPANFSVSTVLQGVLAKAITQCGTLIGLVHNKQRSLKSHSCLSFFMPNPDGSKRKFCFGISKSDIFDKVPSLSGAQFFRLRSNCKSSTLSLAN